MRKISKWKKKFPRIFAVMLAAAMLFTRPGTASVAMAETVETEDTSEAVMEQTADEVTEEPEAEKSAVQELETDDSNLDEPETEDEDAEETETDEEEAVEEESFVGTPEEDKVEEEYSKECICESLCTEESINEDCPVCGAEDAGISCCEGVEENTEDNEQGDTEAEERSIRAIEDLIAALPDKVTEDNAAEVRMQLDKILVLYRELTQEEQEQVDISRCLELQEALDAANAPSLADEHAEHTEGDEASVTIDGTTIYYTTLEEAFTVANGQTATITMLADAECTKEGSAGSPLNITGGAVTLDMGGHILSGQGSGYSSGIVGVSGGSLTVQGNGTVQVSDLGMSCTGGTLTIVGTKFNLVGKEGSPASSAIMVVNSIRKPKVNINGGEITGPAWNGQINHAYGTTIINDVTMTGTTKDFSIGVCYYEKGTLKINGGSFSNITVDEETDVSSVKELLGVGVTYKHQGGTWATEEELAAMSINNVTVEKAPLTVNASAETSWYYGSGEHNLKMNATPTTGGNPITYVWSDESGILDCTADTYTIPADMAAKTYTYTCRATCDGYTLSHDFKFKIMKSGTEFSGDGVAKAYLGDKEQYIFLPDNIITVKATPTAIGASPTNTAIITASFDEPTKSQMALYVGDTQVSRPVDADGGTYTMTAHAGTLLRDGYVQPGQPFTLTAKFVGNDNMAAAECSVTITINAVAKVTMPDGNSTTTVYYGTFDNAWTDAQNNSPATVTLLADAEAVGRLTTTSESPIVLDAGVYTLTLPSSGLSFGGSVRLQGGTFRSVESITFSGKHIIDLLDNSDDTYRAFYKDGQPVPLEANQNSLPAGTYEVKECSHAENVLTYEAQEDGATHKKTCLACGMTWDAEAHALGTDNYCSGCSVQLAAQVETDGTAACYTTIETGWAAAKGKTATVTLLDNVETREVLEIAGGDTITFDGGEYSLTIRLTEVSAYAITINGGKLMMQSGTITAKGIVSNCVKAAGGTFVFTGGKVEASDNGINAAGGTVQISGGEASGSTGLFYNGDGTVQISGGTFTGTSHAVYHYTGKVSDILLNYGDTDAEKHYAFYNKDGLPVSLTDETMLGKGSYTVQECHHEGAEFKPDEGGTTHSKTCGACGYTETGDCSYSFDDGNIGTCSSCGSKIEVTVTGTEGLVYTGSAHEPGVTVTQNSATLTESMAYEVSYSNNINAGIALVIVSGKDGAAWSYQQEFTINKADVTADDLKYTPPTDRVYTGASKTAVITTKDNRLPDIGEITVEYKKDNTDLFMEEAIEPGTYDVYAVISSERNYHDAKIEIGSFTISYMAPPAVLYNDISTLKEYYNGDVTVSGESANGHTYMVSDTIDGSYHSFFTISALAGTEGTVTKTLYFKDEDGHISEGVKVTVKFDQTAPTGSISVGKKLWDRFLETISFGHYAAKEYTVTIEAKDTGGSGIDKIEYVIVTGAGQYTDVGALEAAEGSNWTEYKTSSKPTVPVSAGQYVVYARLTDGAGNVAYISTDGILLDGTPPVVSDLNVPDDETRKDVSAGFTFKVSEAGNYYYVVLPQSNTSLSAEDIIVTCGRTLPEGKTGNVITGKVTSGSGAVALDALTVSAKAQKLQANTNYTLYVTAVDNAVDITNSAEGVPGNIGNVVQADFTTKKTLPVIIEAPTVTGTYGQSLGEMTVTGGMAKGGDTVLVGAWTISDADSGNKPSVGNNPSSGAEEEVTVIFTPQSESYDSVSIKVIPMVNPRSLEEDGVTVSEVAGTYIYTGSEIKPSVEVNTGNPLAGVYLSDSVAELTADDFTISYSNNQNAGTAAIAITGKGNYTGTVLREFKIAKAEGTLTVPETSVNKKYGDGEFSLDCSTNGDGKISYFSDKENVVLVSADGMVQIIGAGTAEIRASLEDGTNHTGGAVCEIMVTVAKAAAPVEKRETRKYTYSNGSKGEVSIDVAQKFPDDCGKTTYKVAIEDEKGILSHVAVDEKGNLTYIVERNKETGDRATITVTAEMANYETGTYILEIELVEKKEVELAEGSSVSISGDSNLTYGEELSGITLNDAIFVEQGTNTEVKGSLLWKDSSFVPNAGQREAEWVFIPEDDTEYKELTGILTVTVLKAEPRVEVPIADTVIYHPSKQLSSIGLTGGSATWTVGGKPEDVAGTWSWKESTACPTVGNSGYTAVYTPEDEENYHPVESTVRVKVEKAVPYMEGMASAEPITYGDTLSKSALTGAVKYSSSDDTPVPGIFTWKDGAIRPTVSNSGSTRYTVVFTPEDRQNYDSIETQATLEVKKAENAPDMPTGSINAAWSCKKVSQVELPKGWQWKESYSDRHLEVGVALRAVAVYIGEDKDNYQKTEIIITITRSTCNHEETEQRDEKEATCEAEGYSGDVYCRVCGELLSEGRGISALGHSYHKEMTKEPTVTEEGIMTYTCIRCGSSYTEAIDRLEEPSSSPSLTPTLQPTAEPTQRPTVQPTQRPTEQPIVEPTQRPTVRPTAEPTQQPTAEPTLQSTVKPTPLPTAKPTQQPIAELSQLPTVSDSLSPSATLGQGDNSGVGIIGRRPEKEPFIKGKDGKMGWDVIRAEEEKAEDGNIINVDMNGSTVVPGDIFDKIKGRDITITFDMGNGIIWSVNGKGITGDNSSDRAGDIDFSVKTGVSTVPMDIVNNVIGESYSIQISLAYEGEFGFIAVLSINLGEENAGYISSLYYYNEGTGELEFICSNIVAEDGTTKLAFTHASDYVIAIDEEESGVITENAKSEDNGGAEDNLPPESPKTMQGRKNVLWPVIAGIIALLGIGFVGVFVWKKKEE